MAAYDEVLQILGKNRVVDTSGIDGRDLMENFLGDGALYSDGRRGRLERDLPLHKVDRTTRRDRPSSETIVGPDVLSQGVRKATED